MGKIYSGEVTLKFAFSDLLAKDDDSLIDALFPNGFEGEILGISNDVIHCEDEETGEEIAL